VSYDCCVSGMACVFRDKNVMVNVIQGYDYVSDERLFVLRWIISQWEGQLDSNGSCR